MTPRQVIRVGVNGSTPCDIHNDISVKNSPCPVLVGKIDTSPPFVFNDIMQVSNKRQSNPPSLVGNTQKLDAFVDKKFPGDLDSASIFRKVIGHKLSEGSSGDLCSRCRMKIAADVVQTQTPQFIDLGFSTINTFDESRGLSNPATKIRMPTDISHWSVPYHVFGEATLVGISVAKSEHDYNYKTEFQIWRGNQEFYRQNVLMSQPPLELTPIGANTTNAKTSHLKSTPVATKMLDLKPLKRPTESSNAKKNGKRARTRRPGIRPIIFRLIIKKI